MNTECVLIDDLIYATSRTFEISECLQTRLIQQRGAALGHMVWNPRQQHEHSGAMLMAALVQERPPRPGLGWALGGASSGLWGFLRALL